jgi:transcriptional regulator with XRE-family HTH domain
MRKALSDPKRRWTTAMEEEGGGVRAAGLKPLLNNTSAEEMRTLSMANPKCEHFWNEVLQNAALATGVGPSAHESEACFQPKPALKESPVWVSSLDSGTRLMASVDCRYDYAFQFDEVPEKPLRTTRHQRMRGRAFHRVAEVRQRQQVSLRNAARRLGVSIAEVRRQERAESDLTLSQLLRWQQVLSVPVGELLVEAEGQLAGPVLERARMIRLMKTAAAIRDRTRGTATGRLVDMIIEQLVELMPEVEGVTAWPESGQQRRLDELGRTACFPVADELFGP